MKQVGYRPFHATKRLNNGEEDQEEDSEESLREFIKEHLRGVFYLGMKRSSLEHLQKGCPKFLNYITKNYPNSVEGCVVATRQPDKMNAPSFYVLLPDQRMTVMSWDRAGQKPVFHSGEDLARSMERFK